MDQARSLADIMFSASPLAAIKAPGADAPGETPDDAFLNLLSEDTGDGQSSLDALSTIPRSLISDAAVVKETPDDSSDLLQTLRDATSLLDVLRTIAVMLEKNDGFLTVTEPATDVCLTEESLSTADAQQPPSLTDDSLIDILASTEQTTGSLETDETLDQDTLSNIVAEIVALMQMTLIVLQRAQTTGDRPKIEETNATEQTQKSNPLAILLAQIEANAARVSVATGDASTVLGNNSSDPGFDAFIGLMNLADKGIEKLIDDFARAAKTETVATGDAAAEDAKYSYSTVADTLADLGAAVKEEIASVKTLLKKAQETAQAALSSETEAPLPAAPIVPAIAAKASLAVLPPSPEQKPIPSTLKSILSAASHTPEVAEAEAEETTTNETATGAVTDLGLWKKTKGSDKSDTANQNPLPTPASFSASLAHAPEDISSLNNPVVSADTPADFVLQDTSSPWGSDARSTQASGTYVFASTLSAFRAANGGAMGLPSAVDQVVLHINRNAKEGQSQMSLQLQPSDLGKISVTLDIGKDGRVQGSVVADNPQTLEMLQKDSRSLERALQDAGLRADPGSLQFSLGEQKNQNAAGQTAGDGSRNGTLRASNSEEGSEDESATGLSALSEAYYVTSTGVNIQV